MVKHELLDNRIFKNGGDMHSRTAQKQIGFLNQKGKPPKLLQQSGGMLRSEKRRLHLHTV